MVDLARDGSLSIRSGVRPASYREELAAHSGTLRSAYGDLLFGPGARGRMAEGAWAVAVPGDVKRHVASVTSRAPA
jgi:hypothetical protein